MIRGYIIIILTFLALAAPQSGYAQITSNTDSLEAAVQQAQGAERAELLLELAEKIWRSDPIKGVEYASEALEIARRTDDHRLQVKALGERAYIHSIQDKYPLALEDYTEALETSRSVGDKAGEARSLHNLGLLYQNQSNYGKALDYYFQALRIEEELGGNVFMAHTLVFIGMVYEERDELENAIEVYRRALRLSEEADDAKEISIAAVSVGNALKAAGRSEEAIAMFQKALDAADELNSSHAKATILLDMSSVYQSKKAYQDAIRVNMLEVENARQVGSLFLEAQGFENLGGIYAEMDDAVQAIGNLEAARMIFDTLNIGEGAIRTRIKLAHAHLQNANYDEAIAWGSEALDRAAETKALDSRRDALEVLGQAYIEQGDFRKATDIQKQLLAVKDSAFNREQERQISEMRARYETEQKEQEIVLLQKEKENEALLRNAFAAGLVLILIIGLLVYNRQRLKIRKNKAELENIRLKEEKLKQDVEFKNRQLTTHTLNLVQKNEVMKELKQNISQIKKRAKDGEVSRKLSGVEHLVDYSFNLDEDWEEFKLYFEEIHTGFFETLKQRYPDLTPNELRLSALVKLNLSTKEIATIMGITPDSVKTARYRLRKKLGMETEENLTEFMMGVEKDSVE